MESTTVTKGELEVMGVSRSGRVRKKSSKLMDFQSTDEVEPRSKKVLHTKSHLAIKQVQQVKDIPSPTFEQNSNASNFNNSGSVENKSNKSDDELLSSEDGVGNDDSLESDADSDDPNGPPVGVNDEDDESYVDPTVRQSIYMSEKVSKKKLFKDGKVVYTKAQRKDKGKTRYTAYMLWARDIRKQMLSQQPDLDFATVSRRLGEMWANVPNGEKYNLKRRAKRQSTRAKRNNDKISKSPSKFLNKCSTSTQVKKNATNEISLGNDAPEIIPNINSKSSVVGTNGIYKVTGIDPVDVAAHLKLLGDSLTIIGERLKEHEGQITVSGSLSVLLDSLLCSLGPLMCLTTQIPSFGDAHADLRQTLQNTLDNIAYVMPGL